MKYDVVIGIEVHAQLDTMSKAYCSCKVSTKDYENHLVCPVCSAQPGSLPTVNKKSVEYACKLAMALNCRINKVSFFDRKNYFYPDLPKGYQITQFFTPIAVDGHLGSVHIERIQMEEDTGKSSHDNQNSYINLNRAGTQLIEIVSGPNMSTASEASGYLKSLHTILVYLGICKGNMQDGNFRADVNLSLKPKGSTVFGTRTEVKNLNSFKNVEKAIEYEIKRQSELLDKNEKVKQQTLLFDAEKMETYLLREKSNEDDYRYFPDPDLGPLALSDKLLETWEQDLPELPEAKKNRFMNHYSLSEYDASILIHDKDLAFYFEEVAALYKGEAKKAANWIMVELLRYLNESGKEVSRSPVSAKNLASLLNIMLEEKISGKQGKEVFEKMFDTSAEPEKIISDLGLEQVSSVDDLEPLARKIIEANPKEVGEYLSGRDRMLGFFVGQIMKETEGKANPKLTSDLVKKLLDAKK